MNREAILLVNMGGPDGPAQVKPYLREIFCDPAIIPLPGWLRDATANLIASQRTSKIIERYNLVGGKSPLGKWTRAQARELAAALKERGTTADVRYAFRYSPPFIGETLAAMSREGVAKVKVVPLFPHHTFAMTGSVLKEVITAANRLNLEYEALDAFGNTEPILKLWQSYLERSLELAGPKARVMFVAHGIPLRNIRRGDPYASQVESSAQSLAKTLPSATEWSLCYQSKVGPVEWTGPYMEAELIRLSASAAPVVIMPLSFVADCLETLYDLDTVALDELRRAGVEQTIRARVFNDDPRFAQALSELLIEKQDVCPV